MALIFAGSLGSFTASELNSAALHPAVAVDGTQLAATAPVSMSFPPTVTVMTDAFAKYGAEAGSSEAPFTTAETPSVVYPNSPS